MKIALPSTREVKHPKEYETVPTIEEYRAQKAAAAGVDLGKNYAYIDGSHGTIALSPNQFGASSTRNQANYGKRRGVFDGSDFDSDPLGSKYSHRDLSDINDENIQTNRDIALEGQTDDDIEDRQVNFKGLYTKYYSASDFRFYIGDILVDRASGIGLNESLSSVPMYTIGNSRFEFLSRGNNIVHGFISINKCTKDYLARIILRNEGLLGGGVKFKSLSPYEQMQLTAAELEKYQLQEQKFAAQSVSSNTVLDWSDLNLFNIDMVYDNSDPTHFGIRQKTRISEIRIIGYEHGVDISGDGQLIDGYKFIAKEVIQGID